MFGLIGIQKARNLFFNPYLIHIVVLIVVHLFWFNSGSIASTWVDVMAAKMACSASYPDCTCDVTDTSSGGVLNYRIDKRCPPHQVLWAQRHYVGTPIIHEGWGGFYVYKINPGAATCNGQSGDTTSYLGAWILPGDTWWSFGSGTVHVHYCDGLDEDTGAPSISMAADKSTYNPITTCNSSSVCNPTTTTYASFTNVQFCDSSVDPCCSDPDPCCGRADPCCGNSDPCCRTPDNPCCVDPACCGDICCQLRNQDGYGGS